MNNNGPKFKNTNNSPNANLESNGEYNITEKTEIKIIPNKFIVNKNFNIGKPLSEIEVEKEFQKI